jgi:phage repressor protein C with HTH and peptisase S24 domain
MPQLTHAQVWGAIDALAAAKGLSASGLAKRAGLDATTFNPSKRTSPDGRDRWPSTESISKILEATQTRLDEFVGLIDGVRRKPKQSSIPLLGLAQAGAGGFFDDAGLPAGQGWDEVTFPGAFDGPVYALEITGESMLPLYRSGDVIIVAPNERVRKGDRVVVKTVDGEVMAKVLARQTAKTVELASLNPEHPPRTFKPREIEWMARIMWATQ